MIDLDAASAAVRDHSLVRDVEPLPTGPIRIETTFLYPDGGSIDLFVAHEGNPFPEVRLTDLAQTMAWLMDVQVKPWLFKKRQSLIEDALRIYRVDQRGGELCRPLEEIDDLMPSIVALGQTCVRVSDLPFTKRSALITSFAEEIEDVLTDTELPYDANVELEGGFGNVIRVDFVVQGPSVRSALLGLSSGNTSQAHVTANEVFRRWYDLSRVTARTEQRVTVLDDRFDVYRDDDLQRLRDVSDLVALSDRQTLRDLLAA